MELRRWRQMADHCRVSDRLATCPQVIPSFAHHIFADAGSDLAYLVA